MPINVPFELTLEQRVDAILLEVEKQPNFDFATLKTQSVVKGLIISHLLKHGWSMLCKPLPDGLLLRRQDAKSALKGLLNFR